MKKCGKRHKSGKSGESTIDKVVLVGTYKKGQLEWIGKSGIYNYPIKDDDRMPPEAFGKIVELWLYLGTKGVRTVKAVSFRGIMSRDEFLAEFTDYPKGKGKPHSDRYAVFEVKDKAENRYSKLKAQALPEDMGVMVRFDDFKARTPAISKAIKAYQDGGEFGNLLDYLPSEIASLPRNQLRVYESWVQMDFIFEKITGIADFDFSKSVDRPVAIDLFAGCGGLSLGFEQAGFDIAAAVEIDPVHAAVHEYNFPYSKTICADIKNITGAEIRRIAGLKDRDVDVVFGGAPCQGFSLIGKRALDDPRNQLIGHFLRVVAEIRPKYCVLENVKGLTVGNHVRFLRELIDELGKIEYRVLLPYRVLNAADFSVPQRRERLFLMAARKDQAVPDYPNPTSTMVTVRDAIEDLPDADDFECLLVDDSVSVKWDTRSEYGKKLRGEIPDKEDFSYFRIVKNNCLTASRRTVHTSTSQQRFISAPQGETEPHSRFYKLPWEGQSNTLRAGTDSARGGFTSPRPIHPNLPRVVTVREGARLHSYPDWFRFNKTKWHGFREIGNSVPPLLARAVGREVMKALGKKPCKPKQSLRIGDESLLGFDMGAAAEHFGVPRTVIAQRKRKNHGK